MCRPITEADSSAQTVSGIIWAMPVNIAQLGAHLEVYVKANVTTIRLCHRFGQGGDVHIHKLSYELLEKVIEEVQLPIRAAAFKTWNSHFLCFQDRCQLSDHAWNKDPQSKHFNELERSSGEIPDPDRCDKSSYEKISQYWWAKAVGQGDKDPRCVAQRNRWISLICQCPTTGDGTKKGAFVKYDQILESEFGLQALIFSHDEYRNLRIQKYSPGFRKHDQYHTTTCHLILPAKMSEISCHMKANDLRFLNAHRRSSAIAMETLLATPWLPFSSTHHL
ncbi:uncharacterized protein BDZ99DRAFT_477412 [Mytilinidion resinicola]|uniref:Uncharacterized protein n=1 Tax=Mytilinidion resinicola TaxID=574789 RepID=A0A6A6YJE4_9PEZI|nr:uncharacterized protein BDZ99DRAFT_477412 [Mytilinidion resinicola]KAF2808910.1 hypothetical protein BDZ99DRAFT_477412 [Mytilinidion resinicola]